MPRTNNESEIKVMDAACYWTSSTVNNSHISY
jgi:hypothetical protein